MDKKTLIKNTLKIIVTSALVVYFVLTNDMTAIWEYMCSMPMVVWLIIICTTILFLIVSTIRWRILLPEFSFKALMQTNVITGFYVMVLPGQLVSEGAKLVLLRGQGKDMSKVGMSVVVDKILGVSAVLLSGAIGVWLSKEKLPAVLVVFFAVGCISIILGLFIIKIAAVRKLFETIFRWIKQKFPLTAKIVNYIEKMIETWYEYSESYTKISACLLLSIVAQILSVLSGIVWARAVGVNINCIEWLWIDAYVTFVLLLPISIGGIGIREGAMASALSIFGVRTEAALAISLGLLCQQIIRALMGGVTLLVRKPEKNTR